MSNCITGVFIPMTRPNDVDFSYHLWPHGWSTATLWVDAVPTEFRLTHVFNDPLESLIEATTRLTKGEATATIEWSDEPGTYILKLNVMKSERHLLSVEIAEYSRELPIYASKDLIKTTSFCVARDCWLHLVTAELRKIAHSFEYRHYRETRDYVFPRQLYETLERALQSLNSR